MKKITSIQLNNYRAFLDLYQPIELPQGQNLLIYGENGSGKSSLYKALLNFFRSSVKPAPPEKHIFKQDVDSKVSLTFSDFDDTTGLIIEESSVQRDYKSSGSILGDGFIRLNGKIKAFLSYQDLLDLYISKDSGSPNLFTLFVENVMTGWLLTDGLSVGDKWNQIKSGLNEAGTKLANRRAKNDLGPFKANLINLLQEITPTINEYLHDYFKYDIEIFFSAPILSYQPAKYARKKGIMTSLSLNVKYVSTPVPNYSTFLNEAKLSAIAICAYLAGLKNTPDTGYKILFLDDIFIGLDTSNRIPLLKILKDHFSDYQIFITTYDRAWFEVAKDWLNTQMKGKWLPYEMYAHTGLHVVERPEFDRPLIRECQSDFIRAVSYLKSDKPDYPAAANYFRKATEGIFKENLPKVLLKNNGQGEGRDNIGEFPEFIMLNQYVSVAKQLCESVHDITGENLLNKLKGNIRRLLNPLSHYNCETPIYKHELEELISLLPEIKKHFVQLRANLREIISIHTILRLHFNNAPDDDIFYSVKTKSQMFLYKNDSDPIISITTCESLKTERILAGISSGNKINNSYISFEEAYDKCFTYLTNKYPVRLAGIRREADYLDAYEYRDEDKNWKPLKNLLVW